MARITAFVDLGYNDRGRRIQSDVECGWTIFTFEGERYLHLETYGSRERKLLDKVSQSLDLSRDVARDLKIILEQAFPGL